MDDFLTVEWVDLEVPQNPRNEGQVWGSFFSLLELPKAMLRSWGVPGFPGTVVCRGSDSTRILLGQLLLQLWVPVGWQWKGVGMCLSLFPGSYSLAGQQLWAGRGAHSFPTCCVSFDLVKSTPSKVKLFGKKIKPDSLTNWKWGKSSVTVNTGCALYCILLFSKLNNSFLYVYIYR